MSHRIKKCSFKYDIVFYIFLFSFVSGKDICSFQELDLFYVNFHPRTIFKEVKIPACMESLSICLIFIYEIFCFRSDIILLWFAWSTEGSASVVRMRIWFYAGMGISSSRSLHWCWLQGFLSSPQSRIYSILRYKPLSFVIWAL